MDVNYDLTEINEIAVQFLKEVPEPTTVAFHAAMGAGKTTFVHALCKALGVSEDVRSPTFSIIHEYQREDGTVIYHIDLYRIKDAEEARAAGVEECFYSGAYCFVEWPEHAFGLLPAQTLHCFITVIGENERNLRIKL